MRSNFAAVATAFFAACGGDLPEWFDLQADVVFQPIEQCPAGTWLGAARLDGLSAEDLASYPLGSIGVIHQRAPEGFLIPLTDAQAHPAAIGLSRAVAGTAENPVPEEGLPAALWTRWESGTIANLPGSRIRIVSR